MSDELRVRIVMFLVWKYMIVQYETNVQWGVDHEKNDWLHSIKLVS